MNGSNSKMDTSQVSTPAPNTRTISKHYHGTTSPRLRFAGPGGTPYVHMKLSGQCYMIVVSPGHFWLSKDINILHTIATSMGCSPDMALNGTVQNLTSGKCGKIVFIALDGTLSKTSETQGKLLNTAQNMSSSV